MSFSDFIRRNNLKNKATSNKRTQNILSSLSLSEVRICLGDRPFWKDSGITNKDPSKGTHWFVNINQNYFDS